MSPAEMRKIQLQFNIIANWIGETFVFMHRVSHCRSNWTQEFWKSMNGVGRRIKDYVCLHVCVCVAVWAGMYEFQLDVFMRIIREMKRKMLAIFAFTNHLTNAIQNFSRLNVMWVKRKKVSKSIIYNKLAYKSASFPFQVNDLNMHTGICKFKNESLFPTQGKVLPEFKRSWEFSNVNFLSIFFL